MMQSSVDVKKLKITTGSVNRLKKELGLYKKEHQENLDKLEGLKDVALKKQQELVDESKLMIDDSEKRLSKAVRELTAIVNVSNDCEEKKAALKALQ